MKIYTKTGDNGETSMLGGSRVSKSCLEMHAIGEIDELNSNIGLIIAEIENDNDLKDLSHELNKIQEDLFTVGSCLASIQTELKLVDRINEEDTKRLERQIDEKMQKLKPLKNFILPQGVRASTLTFQARAIARRAERKIIKLNKKQPIEDELKKYINRLSDFLFTLARYINYLKDRQEKTWIK
ncbi:MAG: cob(I)yrinic acid a,c-diamide adenosyltransferase [Candidatus Magasanikbacteria bacterium]|nr:cob(I)yrinic acid a,c-diamide adenosyltransferase [Candidatus Magasanikbacteria bacterium]